MKKFLLSCACFLLFISSHVSAATNYKDIEDEIFALQKGWASEVATMFRAGNYGSGFQSDGNFSFSTKMNTPSMSGSVNLNLDKLLVTYDNKNTALKVEYGGTFSLELKNSTYEYDDTLEDFVKKPNSLKLNVRFAFTLIQAEDAMFGKLDTFEVTMEGNEIYKQELASMLKDVKKYLGKTYKLPNTSGTKIEMTDMNQILFDGFRLLQEKPLFRVSKVNRNGEYILSLRADVAKKLGLDMIAPKFNFIYNGDTKKLLIRTKINPRNNTFVLENKGGEYIFSGVSKKRTSYTNEILRFTVKKNFFDITYSDDDGSMKVHWDGNYFEMALKIVGIEDSDHLFRLSGKMSTDVRETYLNLDFNGKKIGTFYSIRGGDGSVTYHGDMNITLAMMQFLVNLNGSMKETFGNYTILPPKIYELLED